MNSTRVTGAPGGPRTGESPTGTVYRGSAVCAETAARSSRSGNSLIAAAITPCLALVLAGFRFSGLGGRGVELFPEAVVVLRRIDVQERLVGWIEPGNLFVADLPDSHPVEKGGDPPLARLEGILHGRQAVLPVDGVQR